MRLSAGLFLASYSAFQLLGFARIAIGDWGGRIADGTIGMFT
jgi:hypothetical protein